MKIIIYVRPGSNLEQISESIKRTVEEETQKLCIVKVTEDKFKPVRMGNIG